MTNHRDLRKLGAEVQDLRAQLEKSEASLRDILFERLLDCEPGTISAAVRA